MSGITPQRYELFLASGVELTGEPEPAESSHVAWIHLDTARKMLSEGSFPDGPSLTAISFLLATR
jgi:hypothetical protein